MAAINQCGGMRPGGRSARVQAAVYQAVTDLIGARGDERVTIPAVAARAGVNPTSIYRRWGDAQRLLEAVAVARLTADSALPDTGGLRGDLAAWAERLLADITKPDGLASLRTVVNIVDRGGRGLCLRERNDQIAAILGRGRARGDPAPTPTQVIDHLVAPLYFRVLFGIEPTDAAYARSLVDTLLADAARVPAPM